MMLGELDLARGDLAEEYPELAAAFEREEAARAAAEEAFFTANVAAAAASVGARLGVVAGG